MPPQITSVRAARALGKWNVAVVDSDKKVGIASGQTYEEALSSAISRYEISVLQPAIERRLKLV